MVRLVSFLPSGTTKVSDSRAGVLTADDKVLDLGCTMRDLLDQGAAGMAKAKAATGAGVPLSSVQLLAPVPDARQIFCVGLNYRDHAEASGSKIPDEPLIFNKFPSSLAGPGAPIRLLNNAKHAGMMDYEVEQIAVIGKEARRVPKDKAYEYVAAWMVGNDVSERDLQIRWNKGPSGSQWVFGKGFETSGVCGPWMTTTDEMPVDVANNLEIKCIVNGKVVQQSNTKQHIFKADDVIAHITQYIPLLPGDLIYLGTPAGTLVETAKEKKGFQNVAWLKDGDVVTSECEKLGSTSNKVTLDANVAAFAKL